jgi:hypothetical protein
MRNNQSGHQPQCQGLDAGLEPVSDTKGAPDMGTRHLVREERPSLHTI